MSAAGASSATHGQQPRRRRWLKTGINAATDLLFPPRCTFCGRECEANGGGPLFCADCDSQLALSSRPACPRCAILCSETDAESSNCPHCRGRKLLFDAARTIGPYHDALRQAVLKMKHAAYEPLAIALGQRLADAIERKPLPARPDLVVPVPMHWLKRLLRRTNTAETIARSVALQLEVRLASGLLVCRRYLRRQATLTPPQRMQNVRRAFRASRLRNVRGAKILLVDDMMTTGATAHEASRALRQAGAEMIFVATVARSVPDF